MTRKAFRRGLVAFLVGFSLVLSANVYAWGPEGHEVVALIATKHLSPKAKLGLKKLLGTQTPASVANFADQVRPSHPETAQWHFVDIEITDTDYVPSRDCKETDNNEITTGDCVVEAVKHFSAVLGDSSQSKATRLRALKFLVHFVGDMHQPLHDSDDHDRGGNNVNVKFFGATSNLHKVWDSGIITKHGLASAQFAAQLNGAVAAGSIATMQTGTLEEWVVEAHKLGIDDAYPDAKADHKLGNAYFTKNLPVVETQLTRAGLRLAKILNDIFK